MAKIDTITEKPTVVPDTPSASAKRQAVKVKATREFIAGGERQHIMPYPVALPASIDDLTRDFGDDLYDRMMHDPCVLSCVETIKRAVLAQGLTLTTAVGEEHPDYAKAGEIRDFCQSALDGLQEPIWQVLYDLLDAIAYGNRVAEIVYRLDGDKLTLARIKVKPRRVVSLVVDAFNNLIGLLGLEPGKWQIAFQNTLLLPSQIENLLPRSKFAVLTYRKKGGDPRGQSILRAAWTPWQMKCNLYPEMMRYAAQFGTPSLIGKVSPDADEVEKFDPVTGQIVTDEDDVPVRVSAKENLAAQLAVFRNGSYIVVDTETEIDPLEIKDGAGTPFQGYLDAFDRQIVVALLLQTLTTTEGVHMARAASQTHQDVFGLLIQGVKDDAETCVKSDILTPLVRLNWGDDAIHLVPKASLTETEQQDFATDAGAIGSLFQAGFLDPSQLPDLDARLGLPKRSDEELAARQKKALAPPELTEPGGAGGGGTEDDAGDEDEAPFAAAFALFDLPDGWEAPDDWDVAFFADKEDGHWVHINGHNVFIKKGAGVPSKKDVHQIVQSHVAQKGTPSYSNVIWKINKAIENGHITSEKDVYHALILAQGVSDLATKSGKSKGGASIGNSAFDALLKGGHFTLDQLQEAAAGHPDPKLQAKAQALLVEVGQHFHDKDPDAKQEQSSDEAAKEHGFKSVGNGYYEIVGNDVNTVATVYQNPNTDKWEATTDDGPTNLHAEEYDTPGEAMKAAKDALETHVASKAAPQTVAPAETWVKKHSGNYSLEHDGKTGQVVQLPDGKFLAMAHGGGAGRADLSEMHTSKASAQHAVEVATGMASVPEGWTGNASNSIGNVIYSKSDGDVEATVGVNKGGQWQAVVYNHAASSYVLPKQEFGTALEAFDAAQQAQDDHVAAAQAHQQEADAAQDAAGQHGFVDNGTENGHVKYKGQNADGAIAHVSKSGDGKWSAYAHDPNGAALALSDHGAPEAAMQAAKDALEAHTASVATAKQQQTVQDAQGQGWGKVGKSLQKGDVSVATEPSGAKGFKVKDNQTGKYAFRKTLADALAYGESLHKGHLAANSGTGTTGKPGSPGDFVTIGGKKALLKTDAATAQMVDDAAGQFNLTDKAKQKLGDFIASGQIKTHADLHEKIALAAAAGASAGQSAIGGTSLNQIAGYANVRDLMDKAAQGDTSAQALLPHLGATSLKTAAQKTQSVHQALQGFTGDDLLHKQVGGQGGSNKGGVYETPSGVQHYVKQYPDAAQAHGESVANAVYTALGVNAPQSKSFEHQGQTYHASQMVDKQGDLGALGLTKAHADEVLKGFAADVLLGNWDVYGASGDNMSVGTDGKLYRIDNGGSLLHRAQGSLKTQGDLDDVHEWRRFASPKMQYGQIFKAAGVAKADDIHDVAHQITAIEKVQQQYGGWSNFIASAAPDVPAADRQKLGALLDKRTALLSQKKVALVGQYQAALSHYTPHQSHVEGANWVNKHYAAQATQATSDESKAAGWWQGGTWKASNQHLYQGGSASGLGHDEQKHITALDALFAKPESASPENVVLLRGFGLNGAHEVAKKQQYETAQPGHVFKIGGYTAASYGKSEHGSSGYASSHGFMWHVHVPKGHPMVHIDGVIAQSAGEAHSHGEREMLLNRDSVFRLLKSEKDAKGVIHHHVELIPDPAKTGNQTGTTGVTP